MMVIDDDNDNNDDDDNDNDGNDDFDEEEDGHLAMDNGKCVNPDPPSAIFKLDCMVEQHPDSYNNHDGEQKFIERFNMFLPQFLQSITILFSFDRSSLRYNVLLYIQQAPTFTDFHSAQCHKGHS